MQDNIKMESKSHERMAGIKTPLMKKSRAD
jgi:hypothetical protein